MEVKGDVAIMLLRCQGSIIRCCRVAYKPLQVRALSNATTKGFPQLGLIPSILDALNEDGQIVLVLCQIE